jgi:hypothetical protein
MELWAKERKEMYIVQTVHHNISHLTVPITHPQWEIYLTLPPYKVPSMELWALTIKLIPPITEHARPINIVLLNFR